MPCPDTLIHADCLEAMKHIADGSVDAIIADLPYGMTACKWDTVIPFEPLWEAYRRIIKPNGAIVLTASQPFTSALVMSNPTMFRCEWIWEKTHAKGHLHARRHPLKAHESVLVFSKNQCSYNPQGVIKCDHYLGGTNRTGKSVYGETKTKGYLIREKNFPRTVIKFSNPHATTFHPTQKPVALLEYLVRTYTNPGDLVLDNVMGSATLPVACIRTGRHFIGIEKDDVYFAASVERVKAALAQQAFAFDAPA